MDITDHKVLILIAYSLVLGVFLGFCWGALSFVRIVLTPSHKSDIKSRIVCDLITFFFDVFFALFSSVAAVFLFFGANNGRIRLLGLVGCGVGFIVYHTLIGKRLLTIAERFVLTVRRGLVFIYRKTLGRMFAMFKNMFTAPFRFVKRRIGQRTKKVKATKRRKSTEKFSI
ncbi:MAG: hypothetical protein HFE78_01025 [Clostridiales bacterium]|nr:hypothetical protein [Clostridiales bacterium]